MNSYRITREGAEKIRNEVNDCSSIKVSTARAADVKNATCIALGCATLNPRLVWKLHNKNPRKMNLPTHAASREGTNNMSMSIMKVIKNSKDCN